MCTCIFNPAVGFKSCDSHQAKLLFFHLVLLFVVLLQVVVDFFAYSDPAGS